MSQENQIQANIEEVVIELTQQISQLTYDNAVLKSLVNQYQQQESQATESQQDEE